MTSADRSFIRPYNAGTDSDAIVHIFRETCDDSLKVEPLWTLCSYIWCRPYPILAPRTCFVLDDGAGTAVGYILGTTDTAGFITNWPSQYMPLVDSQLNNLPKTDARTEGEELSLVERRDSFLSLMRNDPQKLIYSDLASLLQPWPGHFHIDILPSHQRQGYGKELIKAFCGAAKDQGCNGAYLGMVASNDGAARFYESYGFRRLPHVLDEGVSGEMGRTSKRPDGGQTIYYVIDL